MERIIRPLVKVMRRDDVPRRPAIGKRDRFHGAFLVAEYRGKKCWQVHGSSDDYDTAALVAHQVATMLDARMGGGLDNDPERPGAPLGSAYVARMPFVEVRDGVHPKYRKRKPRKTVAPTGLGKIKAAPIMADPQKLHVRDINVRGFCTACDSKERHVICGSEPKAPETPATPLTGWDAIFGALESKRTSA